MQVARLIFHAYTGEYFSKFVLISNGYYRENRDHSSNRDSCGLGLKLMVLLRDELLQIVIC